MAISIADPHDEQPPTAEDLHADVDALEARLDHAERRIAEALAPEPVDWERYYRQVLTDAAEAYRRIAALRKGGG